MLPSVKYLDINKQLSIGTLVILSMGLHNTQLPTLGRFGYKSDMEQPHSAMYQHINVSDYFNSWGFFKVHSYLLAPLV